MKRRTTRSRAGGGRVRVSYPRWGVWPEIRRLDGAECCCSDRLVTDSPWAVTDGVGRARRRDRYVPGKSYVGGQKTRETARPRRTRRREKRQSTTILARYAVVQPRNRNFRVYMHKLTADNARTPTAVRAMVNEITRTPQSGPTRTTAERGNGEIGTVRADRGAGERTASMRTTSGSYWNATTAPDVCRIDASSTIRRVTSTPETTENQNFIIPNSRRHRTFSIKRFIGGACRVVDYWVFEYCFGRFAGRLDRPLTTFVVAVCGLHFYTGEVAKRTDPSAL